MGERPQVLAVAGHGHLDLHPVERREAVADELPVQDADVGKYCDCVEHPVERS